MSKKTIYNRLQKEIRQDPKWIEMLDALSTILESYDYLPKYSESKLDEFKKLIVEGAKDRVLDNVKDFPLEDPAAAKVEMDYEEKMIAQQMAKEKDQVK